MTTNDIEKAEILLCCKNGEKLLGVTDDKILLSFIALHVKFVQIDEEKVETIPLSEIIKKSNKKIVKNDKRRSKKNAAYHASVCRGQDYTVFGRRYMA